jgi:hypothetical protein
MIKIYNDDGVLVAESDEKLSLSVQELLEGNGYTIVINDEELYKGEVNE